MSSLKRTLPFIYLLLFHTLVSLTYFPTFPRFLQFPSFLFSFTFSYTTLFYFMYTATVIHIAQVYSTLFHFISSPFLPSLYEPPTSNLSSFFFFLILFVSSMDKREALAGPLAILYLSLSLSRIRWLKLA